MYNLSNFLKFIVNYKPNFIINVRDSRLTQPQIQWHHVVTHSGQLSPVTCQKCQKCQSKLSMPPLKCGSLASSVPAEVSEIRDAAHGASAPIGGSVDTVEDQYSPHGLLVLFIHASQPRLYLSNTSWSISAQRLLILH